MLETWLYSILASILVSAVSLIGILALMVKHQTLNNSIQFLVSLAVGVLLGDAFLHLIPDAFLRIGDLQTVLLFTIGGIILFFFLEKVVRWKHSHDVPKISEGIDTKPTAVAKMNLIGDAIHNFVDGTLIAGSFMVDVKLGITTLIAIVIHEIPQELGDIGTLIYGGYSPKKAVYYNFLCSLTCVLGALFVLLLGSITSIPVAYLLPIAAGGFIYIATADLIPILQNSLTLTRNFTQGAAICSGVGCMILVTILEKLIQ